MERDAAFRAPVWVIEQSAVQGTYERLGDARRIADAFNASVGVIVAEGDSDKLIARGADFVAVVRPAGVGPATFAAAVWEVLKTQPLRIIFARHDPDGRALAGRLAVRSGGVLIAPALMARRQGAALVVTGLDQS